MLENTSDEIMIYSLERVTTQNNNEITGKRVKFSCYLVNKTLNNE